MRGMVVAGVVALAVLLGGCSSGEASTGDVVSTLSTTAASSEASTSASGEPAVQVEPTPDGSRSNPYPLGTVVRVGRWDVVLSDENRSESGYDQSQTTVPEGSVAVSVGVKATLVDTEGISDEEVSAWASLMPGFVAATGTRYAEESSCFFATGGWDASMPAFDGEGSSEGRFCTFVPADAVEGGTWALEGDASGATLFFAPAAKCAVVAPTC